MAKKKVNPGQATFESLGSVPSLEGVYSGDQPNPNLRSFVEAYAKPYDADSDKYEVRAFNAPITTTKATAIYNMHRYDSKKPHDAIRQYIRHHTLPGDIVLDPFCGSGGTALAALIEDRQAIAIDRSPAAAFIAKSYCTPVNSAHLQRAFEQIEHKVQSELDWLYETRCDRCDGKATAAYMVFSQVFQCPRCLQKTALFDCTEAEGTTGAGKAKKIAVCPACFRKGHQEEISTRGERFGAIPVLVSYVCQGNCSPARAERQHNDADSKKRRYFDKYDMGKLREIESMPIPHWFPPHKMMNIEDDSQPWGAKWRVGTSNFRAVAEMYTKRNLWALAAWRANGNPLGSPAESLVCFAITAMAKGMSMMCQYDDKWSFPYPIMSGTYYMPQIFKEANAHKAVSDKLGAIVKGLATANAPFPALISTQSATNLEGIPANSIDYIFSDPPYSDNVQYGELNFVWEAWLDFDTKWHDEEIIVNNVRGKTEADWAAMMKKAMAECYRVLKPGRWLSLCYHDTSEGTWGLIQDILAEVGFLVDKSDSTLFIDTGTKSYNQYTADKATKRDLVLNFRKPKPGEWRITQVFIPANVDVPTFNELGRQVIRDFLAAHPGATKDRVYDAVVSCMVRKGQMEAHDFDTLLRSVAEEVQQPVMEDLFRKKQPDLFGSHVQSRWYLKESADVLDQAEQAKEDAAAKRVGAFIGGYLKRQPELDGVHYSDLFEQYLPVHDKPRRLLADWLPEYFIKTQSGTWRLPDKDEAQQLAELREAGTLRRIKRFANALSDGVPVRDKDRPSSDADLLDWLRQCRRAGLFEQGRAIYEKGGLNLANLDDEQQIEAEDNYRSCVKHGTDEEAKPKRRQRKTKDGDDEKGDRS